MEQELHIVFKAPTARLESLFYIVLYIPLWVSATALYGACRQPNNRIYFTLIIYISFVCFTYESTLLTFHVKQISSQHDTSHVSPTETHSNVGQRQNQISFDLMFRQLQLAVCPYTLREQYIYFLFKISSLPYTGRLLHSRPSVSYREISLQINNLQGVYIKRGKRQFVRIGA